MPNRPNRPQAGSSGNSNGGKSNDISGLLAGILGGPTGGATDAAGPTAADAASNPSDFSGVGPEEGYNRGLKEATPKFDPKTGNYVSSGFTPYQASVWQNIFTRGGAGMQANALNNSVYLQNLQNQGLLDRTTLENQGRANVANIEAANRLDVTRAGGDETRKTQKEAAEQAEHKAILDQGLGIATKYGITKEQLPAFMAEMSPLLLKGATLTQKGINAKADITNRAMVDPKFGYYDATGQGLAAQANMPYSQALALSPKLNPGESLFGNPAGQWLQLNGQGFGDITNTKTQTIDKNTGTISNTDTISHGQGSPASIFNLGPSGKPIVAPPSNSPSNNPVGQFITGLTQPANDALQFLNNVPQQQQPQGVQQSLPTAPVVNPKGEIGMEDYYRNPVGALFRRAFPYNVFNGSQY